MAKQADKQAWQEWQQYREGLKRTTPVDKSETITAKKARMKRLESDFEEWCKYYFPSYCSAPSAKFQRRSSQRIINNPEWFEVRAWSRELAKSTRTMFEVLYLVLTGKKSNVLLISNSEDNAKRLLEPYRANLDTNERIINDYGTQRTFRKWTAAEFKTRQGASFRAVGADQSPRGTRNDSVRPDLIIFDDIDTDQDCRNPMIIENRVNWIFGAVIPTRAINVPLLVIVCGNIIAEFCCVTEMMQKADKVDIVNIRTNGVSSWPEKNSEQQIDRVLSTISFAAAQTEYFNTPTTTGRVFKNIVYSTVPPIRQMEQLLVYADPSTSNADVKSNSFKVVVLLGRKAGKTYVIKTFCEQTTNSKFVQWFYDISTLVTGLPVVCQYWIENNSLQNPFFQQVFQPLFRDMGREKGFMIPIRPDTRKKPDKFARIEGTLEMPVRMGHLIFNEAERDNLHMQTCVGQFKVVAPSYRGAMDAPDAVEGGFFILDQNIMARTGTHRTGRTPNRRY